MSDREKLMRRVQITSFAMFDAALYLDGHPADEKALAYYKKYQQLHQMAMDEFTAKYGPLMMSQYDGGPRWKWVDEPWPWELEANS